MAPPSRYSADFRARAMRLVAEARPEHDTEWAAITSVAHKLGMNTETLRKWIRCSPAYRHPGGRGGGRLRAQPAARRRSTRDSGRVRRRRSRRS